MRRTLALASALFSLALACALVPLTAAVAHADGPRAGREARRRRPAPPCLAAPVTLVRLDSLRHERETRALSLTRCDGAGNAAVLDDLSLLARARGAPLPTRAELRRFARDVRRHRADAAYLVPDAMRVDPGLLTRVQAVAVRFPHHAIEILSGFRPHERDGSRHRHGRALDLRVVGVSRERLRDFARTLPETGVGYYPNSVFVHVDVRDRRGYWVDRSGPGEEADYGTWPPSQGEQDAARAAIFASVAEAVRQTQLEDAATGEPEVHGEAHLEPEQVALP